jgi:hypothetical protein
MDNVSSIIDGSIAVAGMIAAVAVSVGALMASESTTTVDVESTEGALRTTLKRAA